MNLKTHIPERQLPIESETRTVLATNKNRNLKVYLYFTEPVLNTSAEILNSITTSEGSFLPVSGDTFGNRRFGYQVGDHERCLIEFINFYCAYKHNRPVKFQYLYFLPFLFFVNLQLTDVAEMAIVTVSVQTKLVISRQGTSVTPVPPITFLYGRWHYF